MGRALRRHTPEEIDTALLVTVRCGGNTREASDRLKHVGIDVPASTLRTWRSETHADRYLELTHEYQPELEKRVLAISHEIEVGALRATQKAVAAAEQQIDDGEAKDPAAVAKNLTIAYGVLTDKSALRQGKPTSIVGTTDARELLAEIRADLGSIPSTAEELEYPALSARVDDTNAQAD